METVDALARFATFLMSLGILAGCAWIIRRDRQAWRVVVPVMFWASSVGLRVVVAVVLDPPSAFLNQWSRLNILLAGVIITLLMALIYVCIKEDKHGRGGN